MSDIFKVSNSKINTYRRCHRAYYFKYILKLRPKKKGAALRRGSIIHECIEAYNSGRSWKKVYGKFEKEFYKNTFQEEILEFGDIPKMVKEIMENYAFYYEDEPYEYLENELHFELPLMPGVTIEGYMDSVVKDEKNKIWPKESKTYSKDPNYDFLLFNQQSGIYTWAAMELGYKPEGVLWDIIKAKEPSKVRINKDGSVSKSKIDSTPYTIKKSLIELGKDPDDFSDLLSKVSFDDWFKRYPIRINKHVVNSIMDDLKSTTKEILKYGHKLKDRNLDRNCSWCDYRFLCQAELMNLDSDFIIKKQYEYSKEEGRPNGEEESE